MNYEKKYKLVESITLLKYSTLLLIILSLMLCVVYINKLLVYIGVLIFICVLYIVWGIIRMMVFKICINTLKDNQGFSNTYEHLKRLINIKGGYSQKYMVEVVFKDYDRNTIFELYYDYIVEYTKGIESFKKLEESENYQILPKSKKYEVLDKIYYNNLFYYNLYKDNFKEDEISKKILKKSFNWHKGQLDEKDIEKLGLINFIKN